MRNPCDLNKQGIVDAMAEEMNASKAEAERWFNAFIGLTTKTLGQGGGLNIMGFGNFHTKKRDARVGRHPQTGEAMNIPASMVVKFKAGKALKDAVNAQLEEV